MTPLTPATRLLTLKCTRTDDIKHKIFYKTLPVGPNEIKEIELYGWAKCGKMCVALGGSAFGIGVEKLYQCGKCCVKKYWWRGVEKTVTCSAECLLD